MAEVVIMPKLGFNMTTGKLVKWYKNENDAIKKGEPFFAVETDKTNIDIESTCDGVVKKLLIQEGDSVEVTTPIAIIGEENENVDALIAKELATTPKNTEDEQHTEQNQEKKEEEINVSSSNRNDSSGKIKITPRARKFAEDNHLKIDDLRIVGTGFQGGICEKDILNFLEESKIKATPLARKLSELEGIDLEDIQSSGVKGKIMKEDVEKVISQRKDKQAEAEAKEAPAEVPMISEDGKEIAEVIPYSGVRKIIGDRLSESKFTSPHLYFTRSVDLTNVLAFRKQVNASQEKKTSVTDYIVVAVIKALQKYPDMNSALLGDKIYKYKSVNIGVAVAADSGLIVPVIKNAEKMSLIEISKEASRLIEKARAGKLLPFEYTGGTFSVSNLGMFGIENFTAIINPPEAGILAVSATEKRPVVATNENGEDEIVIRPMMNITLSVDHRLIDGLLAAQFVGEVKAQLEKPIGLVL